MKTRTTTERLFSPRSGFTLLELLMVLMGLGVVTGLLAAVLWGSLKLEKSSEQAFDRLRIQQILADQFRADVAQAADAPERWQGEVAGPTCLLLASEERHIVYRWKDQRLVRSEFGAGKTQQRNLPLGWGPDWGLGARTGEPNVAFARSSTGGRLITLRLSTVRKDGGKIPPLDIVAALGGDRQ